MDKCLWILRNRSHKPDNFTKNFRVAAAQKVKQLPYFAYKTCLRIFHIHKLKRKHYSQHCYHWMIDDILNIKISNWGTMNLAWQLKMFVAKPGDLSFISWKKGSTNSYKLSSDHIMPSACSSTHYKSIWYTFQNVMVTSFLHLSRFQRSVIVDKLFSLG